MSLIEDLFSLDGRIAIVTGGNSGIGRALTEALAGAGASVVVVARDQGRIDETVAAVGDRARGVVADLSTRAGIKAAAEDAAAVFGEPDIVVSSAAVNLRPPMAEIDDDVWDTTMTVNLEAPFWFGQRFGPGMASRGYGRLIHLSSQQAHRAFVGSGAYGVSKGGVESLARSQAEAWSGSGVTANVLVPGFVLTPMNRHLQSDSSIVDGLAARTMVGRNGLPDDFAGAAVFLAAPASSYVTGQCLFVDGGFSVH